MNAQIQTMFDVLLAYVRSWPGGETLATIVAVGTVVLMAAVVWAVSLHIRGKIHARLMGLEKRQELRTEGNVAYRLYQILVALAFAVVVGSALPNTTSITVFWRKVAAAMIIQLVAMIVLRVACSKQHRDMMQREIISGIELGVYVLCLAILTFCGMMLFG